jgi:sigma-54 dependent transcriptional regulator, flagellar regulatory protein
VKLLRVLQERVYERVGSNQTQRCDVRIIAATHRNLEQAIGLGGTFREDLYYRLNVFPIELPSLRERAEDLPLLIFDMGARLARRGLQAPVLSDDAMQVLGRHAWPGNVRELANLVELLAVLHQNGTVRANDLPGRYRTAIDAVAEPVAFVVSLIGGTPPPPMPVAIRSAEAPPMLAEEGIDLRDHLAAIETSLIRQAMELSGGVVAQAAKLLKLQRTTLVEKLRKYDLADVGVPSSVS